MIRDYQLEAMEDIYAALKTEQDVLLRAIMGAGKTFMAVNIAQRVMRDQPGLRVVVLAHKKELVQQFQAAFEQFTNISKSDIGICCVGLDKTKDVLAQVTIGTVQSFVSVVDQHPGAGLLVIDEVHRCDINSNTQYRQVIDSIRDKRPRSRILGLTATPGRLGHGYIYGDKCKPGAVNLFSRCHHTIRYKRLVEAGHLVTLVGKIAHHDQLNADLAGVSISGDYVLNQLGEIMAKEVHISTAAQAITEHCWPFKCVCVFCCTIDHAEKVFNELGPEATIVHSRLTDIERTANMAAWESGDKRIIVSVNILIEGFDLPRLDCLVMVRPTLSSSLFLQAVGRVLRPYPGKTSGFLLDLTDNTARFGTDLDRIKITVPKAVEAIVKKEDELQKLCPMCEKECHVVCRVCPHCGYAWPAEEITEAAEVPGLADVVFAEQKPPEPETHNVTGMEISTHDSRKSGKSLGRIDYLYGDNIYTPETATLWLCLPDYYAGYAVEKARQKWDMLTADVDLDFPECVEDFEKCAPQIPRPSRMVIVPGDYPEIERLDFDDVPF